MRDYAGRRPPTPRPDGVGPPAYPTRSVRIAAILSWTVAALFAVTAALTLLELESVGELSSFGSSPVQQAAARELAATSVLVNLVVLGGAWVVLGWLLRRGSPAARVALTVLAVIGIALDLAGLLGDQPMVLRAPLVAQVLVQCGVLALLWRPDANNYLRPRRP